MRKLWVVDGILLSIVGTLVQTIYDKVPYAAALDYHDPLPPLLTDEESQFVQDCLQQSGLIKE